MGFLEITKEDMRTQKILLSIYQLALETLPEGRLHCKRKYNGLQYYRWDENTRKQQYIRKADRDLVFDLKYRRMLEEAVKTIETNLKVQEKIVKKYQSYDPKALLSRLGTVYQDMPEDLLHPEFQHLDEEELQNYQLNYHQEDIIQKSTFGMKFRSKSEAIIGELLHALKIPFYYEAKLELRDEFGEMRRYYPDFTFLPPGRGKLYWDHLGRMDLETYRKKNYKKLADYHHNNILIPDNLIITMESKDGALDIAGINRIITGQLMPLFYDAEGKALF